MGTLSRVFGGFGASLGLVLACSSASEKQPTVSASSGTSGAGVSGSSANGASGASGASGAGGSAAGSTSGGCAEPCTNGSVCKEGACVCPTKKTKCGDACVPLDDPENCVTCGTKCEAGAACGDAGCAPKPEPMFAGTGCGKIRMAAVGTTLYWVESESGKVLSLDLAQQGASPVTIATDQLEPSGIAADASGVYWINRGDGSAGSSKLMKKALPIAGGAPIPLASGAAAPAGKDVIRALALTTDGVLYTLHHDVHLVAKDESETSDVIVGTATNLDLETPDKSDGLPSALAVSGNWVAWTTDERQGVERDDLAEGGAGYAELGESQGSILFPDIGVDGTNVYWAAAEAIRTTPITKQDGPGYTFLTATKDFDAITAFTVAPGAVYFAGMKGVIASHSLIPADPAVPPTPIARDQTGVSSVLVVGQSLLWATAECRILSSPLK